MDTILIPYAKQPEWSRFAPLFGTGEAGGIAIYIGCLAYGIKIVSILFYATPMLRNLEDTLVDYIAEEEDAEEIPTSESMGVPAIV